MVLVGNWIKTGSLSLLPTQIHIPPEDATGSFITINNNTVIIKKTTKKDIQIVLHDSEENKKANANDKMKHVVQEENEECDDKQQKSYNLMKAMDITPTVHFLLT
jgi:hypothetical protein